MRRSTTSHIESTPGTCGGRPRIAGTRIRVQDIVGLYEFQGMSADEIVSGYPHITLADVHAALAYYHDHREEIEADMRADEAFVEQFRREASIDDGGAGDVDPLSP